MSVPRGTRMGGIYTLEDLRIRVARSTKTPIAGIGSEPATRAAIRDFSFATKTGHSRLTTPFAGADPCWP